MDTLANPPHSFLSITFSAQIKESVKLLFHSDPPPKKNNGSIHEIVLHFMPSSNAHLCYWTMVGEARECEKHSPYYYGACFQGNANMNNNCNTMCKCDGFERGFCRRTNCFCAKRC
ncbi:hypothetical protein P3L10_008882 [Capsicum annuum]